jgi:hypothetical protein
MIVNVDLKDISQRSHILLEDLSLKVSQSLKIQEDGLTYL